jgi:hypothetical protein
MTLFIILDGADHVVQHAYNESEARRFLRHEQQEGPEKSFLLLETRAGELVRSEIIKPEVPQ